MTPQRLAEELAAGAAMARRRRLRIAAEPGLTAGLRVERASAASVDCACAEPSNLRVVVEPADPSARYSFPFAAVLRGAFRSAAPVLCVPHRARQRRGPVVTVVRRPGGPAHRLAAEIAATLGEQQPALFE